MSASNFTVNQFVCFDYNGTQRRGTVVEVAVEWIRVELEGGGYRTFRYENIRNG